MSKKMTSKKQRFSFEDMPTITLKKGVKLRPFNATGKFLRNPENVKKALWACLQENDTEGFKEILKTYLMLTNKDNLARQAGVSKRTLYRMLSPEGNPSLENISKILSKLCA